MQPEERRKLIDLALAAGRRRRSKQTGFIHYCSDQPYDEKQDAIPLLENGCFALVLFRSRLIENILEGKELLERILEFHIQGNFPVYLHEYPKCRDRTLGIHFLPILYWIQKDFGSLLGDPLQQKVQAIADQIAAVGKIAHEERPFGKQSFYKLQAFFGEPISSDMFPSSCEDWGDFLIACQMLGIVPEMEKWWHSSLFTYIGPQKWRPQDQSQPTLTMFDLFLGERFHSFSKRMLQDHPMHLRAALIHPFCDEFSSSVHPTSPSLIFEKHPEELSLLWGTQDQIHSLSCPTKGKKIDLSNGIENSVKGQWLLDTELDEDGEIEIAFFCNIHSENKIFVNNIQATTFQLGDEVKIRSGNTQIELKFSLLEGEGLFFGHLTQSNRPSQVRKNDVFTVYDWKIALRTLRRAIPSIIQVEIKYLETGCQQPSP